MTYSSAFRVTIALLVFFTVAWKIAVPQDATDDVQGDLTAFFTREGFNVAVTDQVVNYAPIIRATTDACRLIVARLTPDGSNIDLIHSQLSEADRFFVVFRGVVYQDQPVGLSVAIYLWTRFLREIGMRQHIAPVFAIGANSACDAELLPWRNLPW